MPPMRDHDDATLAFQHLEPEQILQAVEQLGFPLSGRFLTLNSYENRVYQLGLEDRSNIVAKFYRPDRWSDDAILEEHAFAAALDAAEIPVVPALEVGGTTLHRDGPYRFAVYASRGGRAPDLDDLDGLRQLGRLVARIHNLGEQRPFRHRPSIDIDSYGVDSRDYLLDNEWIPYELADAYESVADQVLDEIDACYERAATPLSLRLHGDLHPGNVLAMDGVFHIVDLDDARSGPAVQDLWMFLSGDRDEQAPQLAALLEGYSEFRRFAARELHLVEALRSLRIMHYAAWLARRWADPAFQRAFPWFESRRYWDEHVLALREQVALMQEAPLPMP